MKTISFKYLFRLEKHGGILIDKTNFNRIELNKTEALFLYLTQYIGFDNALDYFKSQGNLNELNRIIHLDIYGNSAFQKSRLSISKLLEQAEEQILSLRRSNLLSFPLEIIIYPSMFCDLKCTFCFLANREDKHVKSAQEWRKILEQAKKNGVLSISILGGEPTRYYDIDNLLLICEELKLKTTITTNAQLIKKSTIDILANSKYIIPVLSLQTLDARLNFELMGVRPDRQIKLAQYFKSVNKECRINAVYTKQTYQQMEELIDFCAENNIDRFSIANYSEVTGYTKLKKQFSLKDLRLLNEHLTQYLKKHDYQLNFATEGCHLFTAYPELINNDIEFSEFDEMYYGCRAKHTKMEIMSNGDVLPCIAFLGTREKRQNAFNTPLIEIWKNDKMYSDIRNFKTLNTKCQSCGLVKICEGGCFVNLMKEKNPKYIKDSVCEL